MEQAPPIEIRKLTAPLEDAELLTLLSHKRGPWMDDIRSRTQGECGGSLDHYILARADNRLVAHLWYTVSADDKRIGFLGHVYTRPDYRRKGIASRLMEAAMADFVGEGGMVMQLYTSNVVTVPFYERFGFENVYAGQALHEIDWYMRYPAEAQGLLDRWLSPAESKIRKVGSGDLPKYCLLYNLEHRTRLKDCAQGIGTGLECEYKFITTVDKISRSEGVCCVLENGEIIVGAASLMKPGFTHLSHVAVVDFYLHPGFKSRGRELLDACLSQTSELGVEIVYAMGVDEEKRRTFAHLGLRQKAVLAKHYKIGSLYFDCEIFEV